MVSEKAVQRYQCAYLRLTTDLQSRIDQKAIEEAIFRPANYSPEQYDSLAADLRRSFDGIGDALRKQR